MNIFRKISFFERLMFTFFLCLGFALYVNLFNLPYSYADSQKVVDTELSKLNKIISQLEKKISNSNITSQEKIIYVVTGNEYEPFTGVDLPNGGLITEIIITVFNALGYEIEISFQNWDDAMENTTEGKFNATFPWLKNKERQEHFLYSEPLYEILVMPFIKKESSPFNEYNSNEYNELDDLKGLRVCRPEGYYIHDLQKLVEKNSLTLIRPKELSECFTMLANDKVDVVPVNKLSGVKEIYKLGYQDEIETENFTKAVSIEELFIIFPKKFELSSMLNEKFNQSFLELEESDVLQKIIKIHLENYYSSLNEKIEK